MRKLLTLLGASALLVRGATVLAQAEFYDASCQPVKATMIAMVKTNRYRGAGTATVKEKAYPVGEIYVGDTLYKKDFASNWSRTAVTPQGRLDENKGLGLTMHGCRIVGNESVSGESAIVYEANSDMKQPKIHTNVKIWISARSGLPLRMDGQGAEGHLKTSMLFTYGADIRAPQDGAPASPQSVATGSSAATRTLVKGSGFPADFPSAPGLSACEPLVEGRYTFCIWHGVDGHAVYTFYRQALLKAGYTILPGGGEESKPSYIAALLFSKGTFKGALRVIDTDLTIQTPPDPHG